MISIVYGKSSSITFHIRQRVKIYFPKFNLKRNYCHYHLTDMAPPKTKKAKLSDSESEGSGSGSESSNSSSGKESTPRKEDTKAKPTKADDSKSKSKSTASSTDSAKPTAKTRRVAGETEPTWELGGKKFITIGEFKGKTYVNIREYYEKDGKVLPSKKGISMNIEQWQNVCSSIDEVNKVLSK